MIEKEFANYIAQDKKSAALKLVEMFNKTFELKIGNCILIAEAHNPLILCSSAH